MAADITRHELVFVDAATPDYELLIQQLLAGAGPGRQIDVIVIDAGSDGIEQISQALIGYGNIDAIHIISHGTDGGVKLGNNWLNNDSLAGYANLISGWGDALNTDADLLFYGCDLAAGADGRDLIAELAGLTGADIAASNDLTGHAALGGDWVLEHRTGDVESQVVFGAKLQQQWAHALSVTVDSTSSGTATNTDNITISHTTSGANRLIMVAIATDPNGGESVGTITYNGVSLTLVGSHLHSAGQVRVEIWALVAPDTGTHDVVINLTAASKDLSVGVMTFNGVDQFTPLGSFVSAEGNSTSATVPVVSATGDVVFGFVGVRKGVDATPGAGQTEYSDVNIGNIEGASSTEAGAASVTTSWALDVNDKWIASGVSINAAAADISGTIFEDINGDGLLGDAVGAAGVDIDLYQDDGDGVLDAGDTYLGSTTTDGSGNYTISGTGDGTYWVVVDSTTITPNASFNGGFSLGDVWAEQTWGSTGAVSFDGSFGYLGTSGVFYGGMRFEVSDDASSLTTAEHVTRAIVSGANVTGVDSAFSFNAVTRTGYGDDDLGANRTMQGSLNQFIQNSNAIVGTQSSQFAMSITDSNYNLTGNGEFLIQVGIGGFDVMTDTVILDATTQAGYTANPIIELDGSGATGTGGLVLRTSNSTIRGFIVHSFSDDGLEIDGQTGFGDNNTLQNNWVGIDATGAAAGNFDDGIILAFGAANNLIGGTGANDGNIIAGNGGSGIALRNTGTNNNIVAGNYIGVGLDGVTAIANFEGIYIFAGASFNLIGGSTPAERNIISGNTDSGIVLWDATTGSNTISGNYIGTDYTGTVAVGNGDDGIHLGGGSSNNIIGGSAAGQGNLISGNLDDGIEILFAGTSGNSVLGNYIGTDASGNNALGNVRHGVVIYDGANNTTIGGTVGSSGNVISANGVNGIVIDGNSGVTTINNTVYGNRIGTNAAGTAALGNGASGIRLFNNAINNTIGGAGAGQGNIIADSGAAGIEIDSSDGVTILGNFIGTAADGITAMGNATDGIWVTNSDNVTIGITGGGNVIASSGDSGVEIGDSNGVSIQANFIGTDSSGTVDLGNTGSGVVLYGTTANTAIGGIVAGDGNVIAHSGNNGVYLSDEVGTGNAILGNSIHSNAQLGIEIVQSGPVFGVTPNDAGDVDTGANNLQNFPLLISANTDGVGNVYIAGSIHAAPSTTYRIEFFASSSQDASGHGEGEVYLGFIDVTTDATGTASFSTDFTATVAVGSFISTTATAPDMSTSEFSANVTTLDMGVLVVDTSSVAVDGDTSSIAALLANRGADNRISLIEAIRATNMTPNGGVPDQIHFNLQLDDLNHFYYQDDGIPNSLSVVVSTSLADTDIIDFDPDYPVVGHSWYQIQPTGALDTIIDTLIIDGYTQPGATPNSMAIGTNAILKIEINGDLSGNANAFTINADNSALRGLAINGNFAAAITINAANVAISGNYIGTDITGTQAGTNLNYGVIISGGAFDNTIGGATPADRNVISGTTSNAVWILNPTTQGNVIRGNYIGTNAMGDAAIGNPSNGVVLTDGANGNTIQDNLISGNQAGVLLDSLLNPVDSNTIIGNLIGVDATGSFAIANAVGIWLQNGVTNTTIGGTNASQRNIISGNTTDGIRMEHAGTTGNVVLGNYIGTDITGVVGLGNGLSGVKIIGSASGNTIGGTNANERNIISDNTVSGIDFASGAFGNVVQGNYIGVDVTGSAALGSGFAGIRMLSGANNNTIGGTVAGAGNVISGNSDGIYMTGAGTTGNVVQGNLIGTDASGTIDIGNADDGIEIISGASGNLIGGSVAGAGNVISGNNGDGISIDGATTTGNTVQGNLIGTDLSGAVALANSGSGVRLSNGATGNTIGGTLVNEANVIAHNAGSGVLITADSGIANSILGNAIYANTGLGIDIMPLGVDANIVTLTTAYTDGAGSITIDGTITGGAASTTYRIEFYANVSGDPSGSGEGEIYLGFVDVVTDASGNATFSAPLTAVVPLGYVISATSTGPGANTSEFAANIVATSQPPAIDLDADQPGTGYSTGYIEDGGPVLIVDADGTLIDPDSMVQWMTVTITNLLDGIAELLAANTFGTSILASYDSATGILTLSGADTAANYQQVLRTITYDNSSDDPDATDRIIEFVAHDGTAPSNLATTTLTVTPVNDAPILVPATPNLPTIDEDNINNGGIQISTLLGGSVSDVDSGAVQGIAITGLSSGNGTWEYSTDGGVTWLSVGVVSDSSALLLRAGDFIRFVPDGDNADTGSFDYRAWDQTSGLFGTKVDTNPNGGISAFSTATDTADITVTAVNDAPVLTPGAPSLPSIIEDDLNNGGIQISTLLGASVSDIDSGAVQGMAITSLSSGNGTWEYSTDGGVTWLSVGVVSDSSALLLRAGDFIRFVPDGENADAASFGFRAWDQSSGLFGTKVDTSPNGGISAFSTATDTADINVTAVNDAPVLTPGAPSLPSIIEDDLNNGGIQISTLLGASVNDVDSGAVQGIAITSLSSGNGTWEYSTDGGLTWLTVGAVSDSSALLLRAGDFIRFVPDGDNVDTASFNFRAWDQTSGLFGTKVDTSPNGGISAFSTATDTADITVTAVNDAPVLTPAGPSLPSITEDDINNGGIQVSTLLGGSISDVDIGAVQGIAVTGLVSGTGTWEYSTDGGLTWLAIGAVSDTNALLLRASDYIRFVPDGLNPGTASFDFRGWDQTSGLFGTWVDTNPNGGTNAFSTATDTADITIGGVNDAPQVNDQAFAIDENEAIGTSAGFVVASDPDNGDTLTYSITGGNTGGAFAIDALTGEITVINPGALNYESNPVFVLTVQVRDDGTGMLTDTATITINLNNLNEAPVNNLAGPLLVSIGEDSPYVFSTANGNAIVIADQDAGSNPVQITLQATNGSLTLASVAGLTFITGDGTDDALLVFTGTLDDINAALDGLSFIGDQDFFGAGSLQITTDDLGFTGIGAALSDTDTINFNITPVNDGPMTSGLGDVVTSEDGAPVVIDLHAAFSDIEDLVSQLGYTLTGNTDPSLFSGVIFDAVAGTLTLNLAADANGITTITVRATDTEGALVETTFILNIAAVNDTPFTNGPGFLSSLEDGPVTAFDLYSLFGDIDDPNSALTFSIVSNDNSGLTAASIDPVTGMLTLSSAADLSGNTTLILRATDASGAFVETSFLLTVNPVDDAVVNQVPGSQSIMDDQFVLFSSTTGNTISVSDIDSTNVTVSLSVPNGLLTLGNTTGLTFSEGDGSNDLQMTFSGSIADVNAALDGLRYTPLAGFDGLVALQLASWSADLPLSERAPVSSETLSILVMSAIDTTPVNPPAEPVPSETPDTNDEETSVSTDDDETANEESTKAVLDEPAIAVAPVFQPEFVAPFEIPSVIEPAAADSGTAVSRDYLSNIARVVLQLGTDGKLPAFVVSDAVWNAIDSMKNEMSGLDDADASEHKLLVTVSTGLTLTLSAGFVSWLMRAGSLLTSLMSTTPLWQRFDPLPVIDGRRDDDDETVDKDADAVKAIFGTDQ